MNRYRSYSRRKRKKGKWIIILIILTFVAFKIYNRNVGPAFTFGDESKLVISTVEPDIEDSALLPTTTNLISEPNLHQIADLSSESNPELATSIDDVLACIETNPPRIIEARDRFNKMLSITMSEQQLSFVKKQLSALSEKGLFSSTIFPGDNLCGSYKVEQGDRFAILGKRFKVPYEILMQINNISDPKALRAGDIIKVINGPFHCKIYRSSFTMDLYLQDTFVRSFSVGLGKPGMETPTGRWIVKPASKLISPTWTDPTTGRTYEAEDPDYPLGLRWIGLEGVDGAAKDRAGFAIHGTKNPEEISRAVSRGCIRLSNSDVILLYNLLTPGVSQVIVVE
jgi:LysM repeat protein